MEKQLIDIRNQTIDLGYMHKIVKLCERYPERSQDLWDSVGKNQFISKTELLTTLLDSGIVNKDLYVIIVGSWYGSIVVPVLAPLVKGITCIDIDEKMLHIAGNIFDFDGHKNFDNVRYTTKNPYEHNLNIFNQNNILIINTSCEHMPSIRDLLKMQRLPYPEHKDVWFAFQSNNMFGIEGHINCKHGIDEFKEDLPVRHILMKQMEIEEERGTRYFLFGKLTPNFTPPRQTREKNNE